VRWENKQAITALTAESLVNIYARNYKNQTILTRVTKNVEDPFLRQCSFKDIIDFPGLPWGRNQNSTQKAFNAD